MYLKFKNLYFPLENFKKLTGNLKALNFSQIPKKHLYNSGGHKGLILYKYKNFKILECKNCNFIHATPQPSSQFLKKFYEKKYYQLRKPNYFAYQKKSGEWWKKIFKSRLILFEKYLKRKGRILDVGCGAGFFLNEAKKRGWDVYGIEPSKFAAEFAKKTFNLKIIHGNYENLENYFNKKFDVIYSHGVLEHISNPNAYFKKIKFFLKKKGLIFSSTANDFNFLQMLYMVGKKNFENCKTLKVNPWFLVPPEHINYFNHTSIKKLYQRSNLKILNQTSTFPIEIFLLSGLDYIKNKSKGKLSQNMRENYESYFYRNFSADKFSNIYKFFFFE